MIAKKTGQYEDVQTYLEFSGHGSPHRVCDVLDSHDLFHFFRNRYYGSLFYGFVYGLQ